MPMDRLTSIDCPDVIAQAKRILSFRPASLIRQGTRRTAINAFLRHAVGVGNPASSSYRLKNAGSFGG